MELDGCGQARVAGVLPVNVPSRRDPEEYAKLEGAAGLDRRGVGKEFGFDGAWRGLDALGSPAGCDLQRRGSGRCDRRRQNEENSPPDR
jgi:hypothetical protein